MRLCDIHARFHQIRVIIVTYSHKKTLTKSSHTYAPNIGGYPPYNPLLTRGSERGREGRGGRDERACESKGHGRAPSWEREGFAPDGTSPGAF